jgi:threonine dehydrogenase-like Zn-dependent dehydrogenase
MNLISAGLIDMKSMISHRMGISDFREAFDLVRARKAIKIILYPED